MAKLTGWKLFAERTAKFPLKVLYTFKESKLSENTSRPMVYGRSVTVQRHQHSKNLKVLLINGLTGVGARDAYEI